MVSMTPAPAATGEAPEAEPSSIVAAAQYLADRVASADLVTSVSTAVAANDALKATTLLADAFILALDAPEVAEIELSLVGCSQELLLWLKKECGMNNALVDKVAGDLCKGRSRGDLRLKCMALLYNAVAEDETEKRFRLLKMTIELAASTGLVANIVETVLPNVDQFLRQWKSTSDEKRALYKTCYEALKSAGETEKSLEFNVKMLELYSGASDGGEMKAYVEEAGVDAIVQAVRLPTLYRFDTLLDLDVVKGFAKGSGDQPLFHALITIFVVDDLAAFMEFAGKNATFLTKNGIDKAAAIDKMRYLTFASLGVESQDLTYAGIASALQIPEDAVEDWVIRAISSGLVEAKMNQLTKRVAVFRSTQRRFTHDEWAPLSERINIWKENAQDLLDGLRETRRKTAGIVEGLAG